MFNASLLGESRADFTARLDDKGVFPGWVEVAPKLSGYRIHTVSDLFGALEPGTHSNRWDPLLSGLLQVAAPDGGDQSDAVLALLHAMAPGAVRLVRRGFDEALVLGQLTVTVRSFPWRTRTQSVAANLLLDTEHALCRETHPARMRTRRRAQPLTEIPIDMHAGLVDGSAGSYPAGASHPAERSVDLVDLLRWARRVGVVDARDLSMLVEYYYAREFAGAGHAHVARVFEVDERTSKRRCRRALQDLRAAAPIYLAG